MNNKLNIITDVPMTFSALESLYPELKSAHKKVAWLEKHGYIFRLKRGFYIANPEYSGKPISTELVANHLYAPSYVSMCTALRYYGIIPETVYMHQSMTIKHSRRFQTPIGEFDYKYISRKAFSVGIRSVCDGNISFIIASPEKALCDLIANTPRLNLRFLKDVENYLCHDLRMDMDMFYKFDTTIFEDYISVGKKVDSISTLLKYLRK